MRSWPRGDGPEWSSRASASPPGRARRGCASTSSGAGATSASRSCAGPSATCSTWSGTRGHGAGSSASATSSWPRARCPPGSSSPRPWMRWPPSSASPPRPPSSWATCIRARTARAALSTSTSSRPRWTPPRAVSCPPAGPMRGTRRWRGCWRRGGSTRWSRDGSTAPSCARWIPRGGMRPTTCGPRDWRRSRPGRAPILRGCTRRCGAGRAAGCPRSRRRWGMRGPWPAAAPPRSCASWGRRVCAWLLATSRDDG